MAKKTSKKTSRKSTKKTARKAAAKGKAAAKKAPKSRAAKQPPKPPTGLTGEVEYLMKMMVANDVTEVDIDDGKRRIALKRGAFVAPAVPAAAPAVAAAVPAPAAAAAPPTPAPAPDAKDENPKDNLVEITSPMVGTFYAAPSPDSEAFVKVGDFVGEESVVCIVEAMKVMNEIKAECSGTIAEVCVKNAEPVEFGHVLFRVKP